MTLKQISQTYPQAVMAVVGAVVLLGSAVGGFLFLDSRYANAEQSVKTMVLMQQSIKKTNVKIDMHAMEQQIDRLENQMWKIEDRCNTTDPMAMPYNDRERYRELGARRAKLERELAIMEANMPKAPANARIVE